MSFHPAGGPPPPGAPQPPSHPRDYNPTTPDEKAYYDQLFTIADTAATGQLQGLHAVNFFKLSGLDVGILKNVWTVADARQQHYLTREDFYVALRLIAMAQNNIPPTREKLHETAAIQLPYARFQNVPPPPASTPPPPPSPPQALLSPSRSGQDPYAMSGEDRARYLNHFAPYDTNGDGFVEGPQAVELFSRSGLDRQALGKVWELSDNDKDSRLSPNEFAVAMHLIVCVSKRGLPVPVRLPPSLAALLGVKEAGGMGSPAAPAPPSSPASSSLPPRVQQPLAASASSPSGPSPSVSINPPSPSLHDTSKSTLAGTLTSSLGSSPSPPTSTPSQQTIRSSTLSSSLNMSSSSAPSSFKPAPLPPLAPLQQTNISSSSSSSSSNSNDLTGVVNDTQALAQKLKAEKISLSATLDSNLADGKRTQAALVKALGEVTSLQGELAALRQAAAAADEEQQQALQNLGGARKQREMLLMEVEKMRGEVERLQQRKSDLSEELAGLRVQVGVVGAGEEGMEALRKDHVAEAGMNRTEIELLQSLLSAMGRAREEGGREVEGLEGQVAGTKQALAEAQASVVAKKEELTQAREERDATTAERHAALVQLASGELKLPPSSSSSSSSNSNGKSAILSASFSSASSPKTTAVAPSSSSLPPSTKPHTAFASDDEGDALSAAAPTVGPSSFGTSAPSFPSSLPSSTAAAPSTLSPSTSLKPPHNSSPTLSSGTPTPPPAPPATTTAAAAAASGGGGVKDAFSDGFDDDGFGPSPTPAAPPPPSSLAKSSSSNSNSNSNMESATVGDDFDFPAPEEGGLDDSFPAPEEAFGGLKMNAPPTVAAPAAAAPVVASASHEGVTSMGMSSMGGGSGGEAGQAMSDPFASDPFSFPDDDRFGDAPPAAAPAGGGGKGGDFGDGFDSRAFDKF